MRDLLEGAGIAIFVFVLMFGLLFGMFKLFEYRDKQWLETATAECIKIAELSGVKEYKVTEDYSCLVVKDSKLLEVKDW